MKTKKKAPSKKKATCPHCNHEPHPANDCKERVCDAAGDMDWCPCGVASVEKAKASSEALAKLQMAIIYMSQEGAFGLTVVFPSEVKYLADKPIGTLTTKECLRLATAGMKAHREALGL